MSWENPRRRRRAATRRRRASPRRLLRAFRRKPKTVPIEMLAGSIAIPFLNVGDSPNYSLVQRLMSGDMMGAANCFVQGFTGYDIINKRFSGNIWETLNPFNLKYAPYTKILLLTGLIGLVRKKLIGRYTTPLFKKIPLIGRWVS